MSLLAFAPSVLSLPTEINKAPPPSAMADHKDVGAPALDTNIESGGFDEKHHQQQQHHAGAGAAAPPPKAVPAADEDEDEDIDALIEDLESQDGHAAVEEEEEETTAATGRVVPEDMLQTDSRVGLTESEVTQRRRKYGLNQMKEEKENLILKFFSYFVGPIQFVMEVSSFFLFRLLCCIFSVCLFTGQCFTCGIIVYSRHVFWCLESNRSLCVRFSCSIGLSH